VQTEDRLPIAWAGYGNMKIAAVGGDTPMLDIHGVNTFKSFTPGKLFKPSVQGSWS
jgi:hypothetical protein